MGNELLFRLRFLEDRAKSKWLRQTAAGPRSSRQGIITRLTRTGHQTKTLVFGGVPWLEGGAAGSAVIHMLDLKTREVSILSGSEGLYSPHWSDFSTHKWAELVSSPAAYPNWSHDGSDIYFINPYIAEPAVYRVRISDQKLELVTSPSRQHLGWHRGEVDRSRRG